MDSIQVVRILTTLASLTTLLFCKIACGHTE